MVAFSKAKWGDLLEASKAKGGEWTLLVYVESMICCCCASLESSLNDRGGANLLF